LQIISKVIAISTTRIFELVAEKANARYNLISRGDSDVLMNILRLFGDKQMRAIFALLPNLWICLINKQAL
jgi:hypothetical protein